MLQVDISRLAVGRILRALEEGDKKPPHVVLVSHDMDTVRRLEVEFLVVTISLSKPLKAEQFVRVLEALLT